MIPPGMRLLACKSLLVCVLCFSWWNDAFTQEVALVLSGGGARGIAHVGVLKALEENHIPIDYITGTSMGAIIGGLYACGYTIEEIEAFVLSAQIQKWATGSKDEEIMFYFKSLDPDASWVNLNFDYDGITGKMESIWPTNLISPNLMDYGMMELYSSAAAAAQYNFDSLLIPFRCVAADIDSNKIVIFRNGQVGSAIRASMTYPFYFRPIKLNGKVLFDGGLYDNFPVDVALDEFHPEMIIGSKATWNVPNPKEDDIISQIKNMITRETNFSIPEGKGIMIEPNLPSINVIDFSRSAELIDSGYVAAMRVMPQILEKINRRESPTILNEKRHAFNAKKPELIVDSIKINGLNKAQTRYIEHLFSTRASYYTVKALKQDYFRLLSDKKIKHVFPTLVHNTTTGFYVLELQVTRAEHFTAEFGGNISSNAASAGFVGIQYNLLNRLGYMVIANGYFGRFYSSANGEFRADIPGRLPLFVKADVTYNHKDYFKNATYFFEDKNPSFLISNESHFNLQFGLPVLNNGVFSLNSAIGFTKDQYYQTNQFTRLDTADVTYFDFYTPGAQVEFNTFNYKQFPNEGYRFLASMKYVNGKEHTIFGTTSVNTSDDTTLYHDWIQLELMYNKYFKISSWFKMGIYAEMLLSSQQVFSNYTATILRTPAFEPIPEMKTLFLPNYRAMNFTGIGIQPVFSFVKNFDIRLEGYLLQPFQRLEESQDQKPVKRFELGQRSYVLSGSLVYHLRLTPISISFNYYDNAADRFSVLFNIGFIIFNKSALE